MSLRPSPESGNRGWRAHEAKIEPQFRLLEPDLSTLLEEIAARCASRNFAEAGCALATRRVRVLGGAANCAVARRWNFVHLRRLMFVHENFRQWQSQFSNLFMGQCGDSYFLANLRAKFARPFQQKIIEETAVLPKSRPPQAGLRLEDGQ